MSEPKPTSANEVTPGPSLSISSHPPAPGSHSHTAPPTSRPVVVPPPQPPSWPRTVGTIAVVFGVLGVLQGLLSGGAVVLMRLFRFEEMMAEAAGQAAPIGAHWSYGLTAAILTFALAAWLLSGGMMLAKRRASALNTLRGWAVAKMLFVLVQSIFTYFIQQATMEQMQAQMSGQAGTPPYMSTFMVMFGAISVLLGVAWGWALPVFFLIWFALPGVKRETASWGGRREPAF